MNLLSTSQSATRRQWAVTSAAALGALLLLLSCTATAPALTVLFQEDFENVPLATSVTYGQPGVWSNDPPFGWEILNNIPPFGVPEWEGWAFVDQPFWEDVGGGGRNLFNRGQGTIAVADPELWNDTQNNPADRNGFYNTLLRTPPIPLSAIGDFDDTLRLTFDSSWKGGCCDDGDLFDPGGNNQTAFINVRVNGGSPIEVLRWESAPFFELGDDGQFGPSTNPFDSMGNPNPINAFYQIDNLNEKVFVDLSDFLPPSSSAFGLINAAASSSGEGTIEIEFGMENAGEDGYWAIDNVGMASMSTLPGDMNINDMLDAGDIDAFAFGLRDQEAYADTYFSYPVDRGSDDSVFNFDDIPWFVSIMEGAGEASAAMALARALAPVPEPSALLLVLSALVGIPARRHR